MISNLFNSFRVAAVKSPFTTACQIQLRDIHLHQPMLKSVEEQLNLPAKPKRPTTAYFRFMKEIRPTVQAKNPKLNTTEISSTIGKMWKSLDSAKQEKYAEGYKDEMQAYKGAITEYRKKLSEDDVHKIKELKSEKKERKVVLLQKRKVRALGKPLRPLNSFIRYTLKNKADRQPKEKSSDFVKRMSAKWNSMTDGEREKYKPLAAEEESYKKAMLQWQEKMRKLGHYDVVSVAEPEENPEKHTRRSSADADEKPKTRTRRSPVE